MNIFDIINNNREIIFLLITFFSVILGPLVSFSITRKQLSAHVISENRNKWINDLREILSKLIMVLTRLKLFITTEDDVKNGKIPNTDEYKNYLEDESKHYIELTNELILLQANIQMLLKTDKDSHKKLDEIVKSFISLIIGFGFGHKISDERFSELRNNIIEQSQIIFADERTLIKKFK